MEIRELGHPDARQVYVIYWSDFHGVRQRFHCIVPEDGYPGLISVPESECEIVDPAMTDLVFHRFDGTTEDVLIHPVIAKHNLYRALVDHQPNAMTKFQQLLAKVKNGLG